MSLDSRWIDAIHTRLMVRYGAKWLNMWAGIDPEMVKADWAEQLSGISADGIKFAMENLPSDSPPNAAQFLTICIRRPSQYVALPAPDVKADPERVAQAMEKAKTVQRTIPRAWAYALQEREQRGGRLTKAQRDMWRAAIVAPA